MEIKSLSWAEHVAHGHIPFRKDCLICQQASSKGKPHRRLGKNVKGGALSIDTSGPFVSGRRCRTWEDEISAWWEPLRGWFQKARH